MKFLESWLREIVNPSINTEDIAHILTMSGLEVESIDYISNIFNKSHDLFSAKIINYNIHSHEKELAICDVDYGEKITQLICDYKYITNIRNISDVRFIFAKTGTILPSGNKIINENNLDMFSYGKLCSKFDLGLSSDKSIMILPSTVPVGINIADISALSKDAIFNLKITPNRADCLSVLGIAREIAAITNTLVKDIEYNKNPVSIEKILPVELKASNLCGRFTGRIIEGVDNTVTTPLWLKKRLESSGIKSISAIVDISNYVMLEHGCPSHIFDLNRLNENNLIIRWAEKNEQVTLLNGQILHLDDNVGVIASGNKIESISGIMGSLNSAVSNDTKDIYIELAFWKPQAIIGKSRKYKISSEASYRFERGVDYMNSIKELEFISEMIIDICGGKAGPIDDHIYELPLRNSIPFRISRCQRILGVNIEINKIKEIFTNLGFKFYLDQNDFFNVTPPSYRFDIKIEEDLIEEIARIYGFDNIPEIPVIAPLNMLSISESKFTIHELRHLIASRDYHEIINYGFIDENEEINYSNNLDPIKLLNPISSNLSVMRSSLIPGLVSKIKYNFHRKQQRIRLFEIGRVFLKDNKIKTNNFSVKGVRQPIFISGASFGLLFNDQWGLKNRNVDFYDVKSDVQFLFGKKSSQIKFEKYAHKMLHPGKGAQIILDGKYIGLIGELHPLLTLKLELPSSPIVFELDLNILSEKEVISIENISRFPIVIRDLSITVNENLSYQSVIDNINNVIKNNNDLSIIKSIELFDVWTNKSINNIKSSKNLGLRFYFQRQDKTLDDETIMNCMNIIMNQLSFLHY